MLAIAATWQNAQFVQRFMQRTCYISNLSAYIAFIARTCKNKEDVRILYV
ncbi:hypothetical protein HMPREF3190_01376 [Umbribacter vaginalis]|nr:hypothetical protein HMPREF3190_01376 [Coriobacteriales bacterium DNF00809]